MGDLGTHPMSLTPGIFLFDGYCHLRNDILKPNGPIDRPEPPRDEKRLRPTFEWMLAGLPWMCASQLAFVDRPINLVLTGVGSGSWSIGPGGEDGRLLVCEGAAPDAAATVTSDGHDFVIWGTKRRPWRDRIGFRHFYARRFRRILPAAAVTLLGSAFVYGIVASPFEGAQAGGDYRAAFLYYANWHFISQASNYFAPAVDASPVLHFWSLAVEEQFYLTWPLVLTGLFLVA